MVTITDNAEAYHCCQRRRRRRRRSIHSSTRTDEVGDQEMTVCDVYGVVVIYFVLAESPSIERGAVKTIRTQYYSSLTVTSQLRQQQYYSSSSRYYYYYYYRWCVTFEKRRTVGTCCCHYTCRAQDLRLFSEPFLDISTNDARYLPPKKRSNVCSGVCFYTVDRHLCIYKLTTRVWYYCTSCNTYFYFEILDESVTLNSYRNILVNRLFKTITQK